jgi:hypothetical protein
MRTDRRKRYAFAAADCDPAELVERDLSLGHQHERGFDFWVLRDPWGNEFCVLQPEFPELLAARRPWPKRAPASFSWRGKNELVSGDGRHFA